MAIKRHKIGFETEILLLEEDGDVSSRADELITLAKKAKAALPSAQGIHIQYN